MPNWVLNRVVAQDYDKLYNALINEETNEVDFNKVIPLNKDLEIEAGAVEYQTRLSYFPKEDILAFQRDFLDIYLGMLLTKRSTQNSFVKKAMQKLPLSLKNKIIEVYNISMTKKEVNTYIENIFKGYFNVQRYGYPNWYVAKTNEWSTKWNASNTVLDGNEIEFTTAWSTPMRVWEKLSLITPITVAFADMDDVGGSFGIIQFENGTPVHEFRCEEEGDIEDMAQALAITGEGLDYFENYTDEEISNFFKEDRNTFNTIATQVITGTQEVLIENGFSRK